MRPLVASPDDILVVAAGGRAGAFSCYIPAWAGGKKSSQSRDEAHPRQEAMMAGFEILDPTVEPRKQPLTYVPRPDSLQGKRIGLVENTKFNSDNLLVRIGEILKNEYGAAECKMWRKHNASVPAHEEIIEEARRQRATASSPASATEGPARRAVCSTESCSRRSAFPRPPS